ncbi:HAD family hydrolase [Limnochorda pilosa]|uniref:HAD family hydrolase n=1 Tax=Limnochorda pilosa TaxID=1555112 RepID=A0A0K2SFT3_LIMPI|nr:HAD-IA family hydrolase [Limnochorda pilosa]BAS25968.1 HAD family hydrolase [Limnochorda pilosa]
MRAARPAVPLDGRKLVLFDLYGTLVHARERPAEVYRRALAELGLFPPDAILEQAVQAALEAYWMQRAECRTLEAVGLAREAMAQAVLETVAPSREPEERRSLARAFEPTFGRMRSWYAAYDDVLPVLERLSARGLRLGVLSNWDASALQLLRELDLDRFFDVVVISIPEGVEKPDPAIFRLALQRAGVGAGEAVMVGDTYEDDILPARELGLLAVHLTRRGRPGGRPDAGGLSVPGGADAAPDGVVAIDSLLALAPDPAA